MQPHTVRIGVLGIFHPQQLILTPDKASQFLVLANGNQFFLEARSSCSSLSIRNQTKLLISGCGKDISADNLRATGRDQQAAGFTLTVPGKLSRRYEGILELKAINNELVPIVTMDLEKAVASTVHAETSPGTPLEALKAQAIVSRSYLSAKAGRHKNFDFCDLTHCQVLREPPPPGTPAAQAASATQSLVIKFEGLPVATMFTRSCGGHTRTPEGLGLRQAAYPYFSVACEVCGSNPVQWTRAVSAADAALLRAKGESGRLAICRKLGWNSVPSNNFVAHTENGEIVLEGTGQGHGIGFCQRGAAYLAGQSSDFREILAHYFPKTKIEPLDSAMATPSN
jgi:stage II sporulation protein D